MRKPKQTYSTDCFNAFAKLCGNSPSKELIAEMVANLTQYVEVLAEIDQQNKHLSHRQ